MTWCGAFPILTRMQREQELPCARVIESSPRQGEEPETSAATANEGAKRMRTNKKTCLVAGGMVLAAVTVAFAAFFQGFETDTNGWTGAMRVSSGTHLTPSKTGAFHAEDVPGGA